MNRFDIVALCAAIGITLLYGREVAYASELYLAHASTAERALWIAGEFVATYGPIAFAAFCWRWSKRTRRPALPHLLALPVALLLFRGGAGMLLAATDFRDFDDTMGAPVIPGTYLFLIAIVIYVAALMSLVIAASRRQPAA